MELTKVRELIANKQDEREKGLQLKPVVKCLMSFVGGFLMMNPFVLGQLSPFSVSLVCALRDACALWAAAGGITGAFLFFSGTQTVKYVAIFLMCILLKGLFAKLLTPERRALTVYINSAAAPLIIGTAVMLATGFEAEEFLGIILETLLACTGTFIFQRAAEAVWSNREISRYTTTETVSVLLSAGIMLMHFYRYKIFDFSPVILLFCACTLLSAKIKNGYGGALCGICLAFAAGISGELDFICLGLAMGGLIGGELVRKSRHLCALGFVFPICLCAVADSTIESYMAILASTVSASVFLVVPEDVFIFLSKKVNSPVPVSIRSDDSRALAKKLSGASQAIECVSECVNTVRKTLKPVPQNQLNRTVRSAWNKVCSECELKESCRPEVKNPTDETIEKLAAALTNNADLDETKFPKGFYASCYCFTQMQSEMKSRYRDFTANRGAEGQLEQIRGLMSDQFRNMADILKELSCELDEEINVNSEAADLCGQEAHESGLDVISTASHLDRFGRLTVSLNTATPDRNFNVSRLTENLSNTIGTPLDLPILQEYDDFCTLKFSQKIAFNVSVGAFSRPADSEAICGDYYRSFRDENDRYIIILSDGMGTGSRAAIDSAMAAELFSRLVKSGLSFDCALSIANSALLVKGGDESLATLDVVCVDLYTGKTDFLKAGAAATYIRHKDSVIRHEQASLPMGILREIDFEKENAALESGDIVLMISDGILGECNGWIQQELKLWSTDNSPQKLAQFIVESACERKISGHRDDMTAVAVYIN